MNRLLAPLGVEAVAWLVLCGSLLVGIGLETDWGRQWNWPLGANEALSAKFDKPLLAELVVISPPDKYIEIVLRPLFVVTRSPAPIPPPPEAPKPRMRKGQYVLTGTTIVADGKFAHLTDKASRKSHVLAEGSEIKGILIKEISPYSVILTQFEDTEYLVLGTPPGEGRRSPTNTAPPAAPTITP